MALNLNMMTRGGVLHDSVESAEEIDVKCNDTIY